MIFRGDKAKSDRGTREYFPGAHAVSRRLCGIRGGAGVREGGREGSDKSEVTNRSDKRPRSRRKIINPSRKLVQGSVVMYAERSQLLTRLSLLKREQGALEHAKIYS